MRTLNDQQLRALYGIYLEQQGERGLAALAFEVWYNEVFLANQRELDAIAAS
jgi:hypothetical protein